MPNRHPAFCFADADCALECPGNLHRYSTNYLIDLDHAVIVEVTAAKRIITRTHSIFALRVGYGCLVCCGNSPAEGRNIVVFSDGTGNAAACTSMKRVHDSNLA